MADCTLVFPFQLFDPHPAIARGRTIVFIEDSLTFGDPHVGLKFHQQKIVLHRSAMKNYAAVLEQRGYDVAYREFQRGATVEDHLLALRDAGMDAFHFCQVVDYLLERRLARSGERLGVRFHRYETPMFLTPDGMLEETFTSDKRPMMGRFYEKQRLRMGVLVDAGGAPAGGRWSYDDANRKPMPKKGLDVPGDPNTPVNASTVEAIAYTKKHFGDYYGDAKGFSYPVTHADAELWFQRFLENRFHLFGTYEDAISERERVLFHGVLSPMLNIGLLAPQKLLDTTLAFAVANEIPLNSVEGFVRQVIGWREFVRGAYQHLGVTCRNGNFFGLEDRPIPAAFYEGRTGIDPVDTVIRRVIDYGWCHHIERLMILGNFMLLCGFHPRRVYDWFMELFVDAYDWVMVPNIFGMSQFADGGLFTTKPYISGSNYVLKMSDFARGDWCGFWDGLFWTFVKTHEEYFRSQYRLAMMAKNLDRMGSEKLEIHRTQALAFLETLD